MKTWIETLEEAKAYHALGAGSFTVGCILDKAKKLYKKEVEEEEVKKRQQKEMSTLTYEEDYKRLWAMKDSGCSVEQLSLEFENLRMKQEADDYVASVKKGKEEREKKKEMTFEETGAEIGRIVTEKNKKYGDSFTKSGGILRILYPDGIKPDQYGDLLAITRILDKFFRISTDKDPGGEDPWADVAGYGILKTNELENEENI
jgi:hypothetical protein